MENKLTKKYDPNSEHLSYEPWKQTQTKKKLLTGKKQNS